MADGDKEWLATRMIGKAITNDNDGICMEGTRQINEYADTCRPQQEIPGQAYCAKQ